MKSQIFGDKTEPVARSVYSNNRPARTLFLFSFLKWRIRSTRVVVERRFLGAGLRKLRSTHWKSRLFLKVVFFTNELHGNVIGIKCWLECQKGKQLSHLLDCLGTLKPQYFGGSEWISINLSKSAAFSLQTSQNNLILLRINLKGILKVNEIWPLEGATYM